MSTVDLFNPPALPKLAQVRIILVNTTLPANIGAAARAMKTMGLSELVLVAPRFFPHGDAMALASGAADILQHAQVVDTLQEAIAPCSLVFGTSARSRTIPWPLLDLRQAMQVLLQHLEHAQPLTDTTATPVAIVFGREDRGLTNDELALCQYHLTIPVNPEYGVLNIAAAVQVVAYELRMQALTLAEQPFEDDLPSEKPTKYGNAADILHHNSQANYMPLNARMLWDEPIMDQAAMQQFYTHFEQFLTDIDFLDPQNPRLLPLRIRRLFGRTHLDRMEYNLLRGIFGRVQAIKRGTWPPRSLNTTQNPNLVKHNPLPSLLEDTSSDV